MTYDPQRKEKYIRTISQKNKIEKFIDTFQGQSNVSYEIIKLFLETGDDWQEINDAQYIFNLYFYQMS